MPRAGQTRHYGSDVSDGCSYGCCIRYPSASQSGPQKESPSYGALPLGCGMYLTWKSGAFQEEALKVFLDDGEVPLDNDIVKIS